MKKACETVIATFTAIIVLMADPAHSGQPTSPIPYGGYRDGGKCGCYGARAVVRTADEARKVIDGFLAGHDLRIGGMEERPRFFRALLVDGTGAVQDVVIVDKLTGRIRSIY